MQTFLLMVMAFLVGAALLYLYRSKRVVEGFSGSEPRIKYRSIGTIRPRPTHSCSNQTYFKRYRDDVFPPASKWTCLYYPRTYGKLGDHFLAGYPAYPTAY